MSSEVLWKDVCPVCNGTGQIEVTSDRKNLDTGKMIVCESCNGKGIVFIVKKIRKKGK